MGAVAKQGRASKPMTDRTIPEPPEDTIQHMVPALQIVWRQGWSAGYKAHVEDMVRGTREGGCNGRGRGRGRVTDETD